MLDHVSFAVADLARSRAFYDKALAPLGISVLAEETSAETGVFGFGYGSGGRAYFWIGTGRPLQGPLHVAFAAPDRKTVNAFYSAALAAGGIDNGAPGLRPHYHPDYYGAFVLSPDGHNIEAVCRRPE